jgi:hypothetical protein
VAAWGGRSAGHPHRLFGDVLENRLFGDVLENRAAVMFWKTGVARCCQKIVVKNFSL